MITEDYVSFETAKLLKEKGFNELCHGYFRKDNPNDLVELAQAANWNDEPFFTSRPTLQMAMKWLREVHNLYIEMKISKNTFLWGFRVSPSNGSTSYSHANVFSNYEEACEEAIKYCLEHLI